MALSQIQMAALIGEEYVFYSPTYTSKYNSNVCTLMYRSRAFSIKLFETKQFMRRQKEIKIKK